MSPTKILLLDFNPAEGLSNNLRMILESSLRQGVELRQEKAQGCGSATHASELAGIVSRFRPALIFLVSTINLLKQASTLFQAMKREPDEPPFIVVSEADEPDEVFEVLRLGAVDFITPPLRPVDILPRVWRALEQTPVGEALASTLKDKLGLDYLVGESPAFLSEVRKIPLVAQCDASVLISGETGTGKELCARAIHQLSARCDQSFIPVNCGAIPVELVENELFGHERGAFTGASGSKPGLIEEADGGTLFLDEIDSLPMLAQVKLLRFLQEKEYRPLGSTRTRQANVRVVTATNINVEKAVREGKLRQDLYYRLDIIPLLLPPLRERREDIPVLAQHFLMTRAGKFRKPARRFSHDGLQKLLLHDWPGNVRELENVIERSVALSQGAIIRGRDIVLSRQKEVDEQESFQEAKARVVAQFERTYIQSLLLACEGNITKAAQAAQKNRRAFWELLRKHQIDAQKFVPQSLQHLTAIGKATG
jgi:DNA-binding NtrC family response regulator